MSGLLEKDICLLLKGHRNTMILFLMICVFLGLSQTDTFILGYFPFLMIVLLIGTLSCDEADNGLPFLFTLPIDRKLYIREKYLFCVAGTVVSFVLAWALYLVSLLVWASQQMMLPVSASTYLARLMTKVSFPSQST